MILKFDWRWGSNVKPDNGTLTFDPGYTTMSLYEKVEENIVIALFSGERMLDMGISYRMGMQRERGDGMPLPIFSVFSEAIFKHKDKTRSFTFYSGTQGEVGHESEADPRLA